MMCCTAMLTDGFLLVGPRSRQSIRPIARGRLVSRWGMDRITGRSHLGTRGVASVGFSGTRSLGPAARGTFLAVEQSTNLLAQGAGRHENAVPGGELIVGRSIAQLDDLAVTDGQDDAATVGVSRSAEDDLLPGAAIGKPTRRDDAVEHGLPAVEGKRPGRVYLTQDVIDLADARYQAD